MLEVDDLHAYYGKSHILQGISFRVREGETIVLTTPGGEVHARAVVLATNAYTPALGEFRHEILPLGRLSYIGTPLRTNVRSSWRRGVEPDLTLRPKPLRSRNCTRYAPQTTGSSTTLSMPFAAR